MEPANYCASSSQDTDIASGGRKSHGSHGCRVVLFLSFETFSSISEIPSGELDPGRAFLVSFMVISVSTKDNIVTDGWGRSKESHSIDTTRCRLQALQLLMAD